MGGLGWWFGILGLPPNQCCLHLLIFFIHNPWCLMFFGGSARWIPVFFFFWAGGVVKNRDSSESYSPTLSSNCCSSLRFFGLPPNLEGYRSWLACCCSKEGIGMLAPCSHQDHDVFLRVPKLNTIASRETCIPRHPLNPAWTCQSKWNPSEDIWFLLSRRIIIPYYLYLTIW